MAGERHIAGQLTTLTRHAGWQIVAEHFAGERAGREAELIRRGTDDRTRNELAAEVRTIDELLAWPATEAVRLYELAQREES